MFKKIKTGFGNYLKATKSMSFKEKAAHTWEYYKWILGILIGAVIIFMIVFTGIRNANTDTIIAGVGSNVELSAEGVNFVTNDFYKLKKTEGRQKVDFSNVYLFSKGSTEDLEATYDTIQSLLGQVGAKKLDYIFMDETSFEYLVGQEIFVDLREFLSEEELEKYKDNLIYAQEENSNEMFPSALNITDTAFSKKYITSKNKVVYMGFTYSSDNKHKAVSHDFLDYILSVN